MQVNTLAIPELILMEPRLFQDDRGYFFESFRLSVLEEVCARKLSFVQENISKSVRNVVRGLHCQIYPKAQAKLIRVISGSIFDVAVDIRPNSATFGQWASALLSAENKQQLWIPEGFAHGFMVLSDQAEVMYKTTEYYAPEHEVCILWNDPAIGIEWPIVADRIVSSKDRSGLSLSAVTQLLHTNLSV